MTEDEMDERTREALRGYRVPPAPPLDEMWDAIEERHFGAPGMRAAVMQGGFAIRINSVGFACPSRWGNVRASSSSS